MVKNYWRRRYSQELLNTLLKRVGKVVLWENRQDLLYRRGREKAQISTEAVVEKLY